MRILQLLLVAVLCTPALADSLIGAGITVQRVYWSGSPATRPAVFPLDRPTVFESASFTAGPGPEFAGSTFISFEIDVDSTSVTLRGLQSVRFTDVAAKDGLNGIRLIVNTPANLAITAASVASENVDGFDAGDIHVVDNYLVLGLDGADIDTSTVIEIDLTLGAPLTTESTFTPGLWGTPMAREMAEDYEDIPDGFHSDAAMDAFYGETDYTSYAWADGEHQVQQGNYNAGITPFTMDFTDHSLAADGGVSGVLLYYATLSNNWSVRITYADGRFSVHQILQLNSTLEYGYLGLSANLPIARVDICDGLDPAQPGTGIFFLEELTVGSFTPAPSCTGDVDGDGDTDAFDFAELALAFGTNPGETNWNADADLVQDGTIDAFDFAELAEDFGCAPSAGGSPRSDRARPR